MYYKDHRVLIFCHVTDNEMPEADYFLSFATTFEQRNFIHKCFTVLGVFCMPGFSAPPFLFNADKATGMRLNPSKDVLMRLPETFLSR